MKKLTSIAVLLLSATVLSSCGEEAFPDITGPLAESRIKFFNFSVGAPGVYFYANGNKVAGITGTVVIDAATGIVTSGKESVTGTIYGGVTAGGLYSAIAPGSYDLKAQLADTTQRATVVSAVNTTIASGKHYSYFISGAYSTATKSAEAFIVEDNFPVNMDWTQAYVRFVNAGPTSAPLTLYGTNTTTAAPEAAIGAITAYKGGSAFVGVPTGSYTLVAKDAGGVSKITRTAVSFSAGRVYTITLRGTTTLFLDNTTNR
ncbi:MAG: DUF4397 domain-containing protein [Gemmatimonadaceae bacterium]|nr:DUF4397 domain-containing protein [Gemmatimonadaceae bacterium]